MHNYTLYKVLPSRRRLPRPLCPTHPLAGIGGGTEGEEEAANREALLERRY